MVLYSPPRRPSPRSPTWCSRSGLRSIPEEVPAREGSDLEGVVTDWVEAEEVDLEEGVEEKTRGRRRSTTVPSRLVARSMV